MIYRDSKTGRFASKSTYTRSRARGGKRYRRETTRRERERAIEEEREEEEEPEYTGAFDSPGTKRKRR